MIVQYAIFQDLEKIISLGHNECFNAGDITSSVSTSTREVRTSPGRAHLDDATCTLPGYRRDKLTQFIDGVVVKFQDKCRLSRRPVPLPFL